MKNGIVLIILLLIVSIILLGCGKTEDKSIAVKIGIGDKVESFEKEYGKNISKVEGFKQYENGDILAMAIKDRISHLTISLKGKEKKNINSIESFLPRDKKLLKEEIEDTSQVLKNDPPDIVAGMTRYITIYESPLLREVFPSSEGKFIVIQRVYPRDNKNVFVIGLGVNP